jgi:hypothetical protein
MASIVAPDPSLNPLTGNIGGPATKTVKTPVATTMLPALLIGLLVVLLVLAVLAYAFLR